MDRNSVRLVEGKMIRNSRNRRFRTCLVDPTDAVATSGGRRFRTDFAMVGRVTAPRQGQRQLLDSQGDSASGSASLER